MALYRLLAEGDEVRHIGLTAAFILTPFISLYWAGAAFICGWIGGWKLVMDEWTAEE